MIAVIPSRFASSRLPGKPLIDICGRTMVEQVYRRSVESGVFQKVVVATDDERIYDTVKKFGGDVMLTRTDHPDGTSRVAEVVANEDADYVVNIQGDEPMLDPRMLKELAEGIASYENIDSATVCVPIKNKEDYNNPNIVKVVRALDGKALYFSRSLIPYEINSNNCPVWEHLGIYAFKKDFLLKMVTLAPTPLMIAESLEQLRILEHGYSMAVIPTKYPPLGPNVNTIEDLEKVRKILEQDVDFLNK
ncbi:MAG: 3-deoxy-manno-octulosonate cytidylyltransferase [Synergistaceae bacterium]|nr:3-deoxy-manno-octulosonate cytidylyltransferase [Synergistaceae bacterium]